ncbi:hypothetical protein V511_13920 [Mesotoga sp. Brook.08.YT.4.2.5.1]|uniref:Uncharacterized protein n=1 Tax=Mesotoga prima TaxID=1184387 RepID=A0A117M1W0_9BACT|nr:MULTISPECIES: hypothetical protein [unclassified Mesotoga]KUK79822.1 MAG: Uncharacterized protein XD94_1288 [Mesotoga prima]PNE18058.1 hypothetical protein V511_13920 [Mesotoga sp. Brook.08.YT.4.2.5.1]PNS41240.1 hypothetical protein RJ60_05475 [Mesotoga sp. B105.6.4]PVD16994.1 hypothetical protein V512_008695 [Mesotoga sp. Brook.08.105.5.1]RAO97011.1 hypothetical protein M388_12065 [Mesotoga sp. Brook.08.YT.4.2.5.4.]
MNKTSLERVKVETSELDRRVKNYSERADDGTVNVKVEDKSFGKHDAEKLIELLEERTRYLPLRRGLSVSIEGTESEMKEFFPRVRDSLVPLVYYIDLDLKRLARLSVILIVVGMLAMGIASILTELSFNAYALHEILVIASWVFIWAAVETFFFERRKLKNRKHHFQRIYSAEFTTANQRGSTATLD